MQIKGASRRAANANEASEGSKGAGRCLTVPYTSDGTEQQGT